MAAVELLKRQYPYGYTYVDVLFLKIIRLIILAMVLLVGCFSGRGTNFRIRWAVIGGILLLILIFLLFS